MTPRGIPSESMTFRFLQLNDFTKGNFRNIYASIFFGVV